MLWLITLGEMHWPLEDAFQETEGTTKEERLEYSCSAGSTYAMNLLVFSVSEQRREGRWREKAGQKEWQAGKHPNNPGSSMTRMQASLASTERVKGSQTWAMWAGPHPRVAIWVKRPWQQETITVFSSKREKKGCGSQLGEARQKGISGSGREAQETCHRPYTAS